MNPTLGIYKGNGTNHVEAYNTFKAWLGETPIYVLDYGDGGGGTPSWAGIEACTGVAEWLAAGIASDHIIWSVPIMPGMILGDGTYNSTETLAAGAAGNYNAHFDTLADNLISVGADDCIVRLGWEMNGTFFPWRITDNINSDNNAVYAANYATYFQQIVNTMRAASGANFEFNWCPNYLCAYIPPSWDPLYPAACYPGDAYVDYIGLDIYDRNWPAGEPFATRWNAYLTSPSGLNWHKTFGETHSKKVAFDEWGCWPSNDNGGGDAPEFISAMNTWFADSNLAYQSYFDFVVNELDNFPNAKAEYKTLFGALMSNISIFIGA